jgi:hypothetical protein
MNQLTADNLKLLQQVLINGDLTQRRFEWLCKSTNKTTLNMFNQSNNYSNMFPKYRYQVFTLVWSIEDYLKEHNNILIDKNPEHLTILNNNLTALRTLFDEINDEVKKSE